METNGADISIWDDTRSARGENRPRGFLAPDLATKQNGAGSAEDHGAAAGLPPEPGAGPGSQLDSTAVAYCMRRHAAEVAAFTIGFDVPGRDETTYARLAARHLGLRHHVEVVAERQVPDIITAYADAIDEPIGGGLALAMYVLGRVTRSEAAVVLGGDGGDGQFLGNERLVPPPMDAWLRGRLRPVLLDVLAPARIEAGGLFMPAAVSRLVDQHLANVGNHSIALRLLLMFELWRTRWLRRPGVDQ